MQDANALDAGYATGRPAGLARSLFSPAPAGRLDSNLRYQLRLLVPAGILSYFMLKLDRLISGSLQGPPIHQMRVLLASKTMFRKDLPSLRHGRAQLSYIRFPRLCAALRRGSGTHHPVICQIDANARRSARKSPRCRKHANICVAWVIEISFPVCWRRDRGFSPRCPFELVSRCSWYVSRLSSVTFPARSSRPPRAGSTLGRRATCRGTQPTMVAAALPWRRSVVS